MNERTLLHFFLLFSINLNMMNFNTISPPSKEKEINFPSKDIYKDKEIKDLYLYSINNLAPAFFFLANSTDIKSKKYDETLNKIAIKFKGKIKFGIVDINNEYGNKILNESKINLKEDKTPYAIIYDYDYEKKLKILSFYDFYENYNEANLELFIQNWINIKSFLKQKKSKKSEEEPEMPQEKGKVFKVVYNTFKRDVLDNILNVFVKFYKPNDPLCKEMESKYKDLALQLKRNGNIRIAEYNLEQNDFDYIKIDHYPTLILFRAGHKEKDELIEYKGNMKDVNDMIYFVLTNQAFPILEKEKNKKKEDKNKDKVTTDL